MQVMQLRGQGKLLEAQRLLARTKYDLEMMQEVGYCSGIENYSRHLDGRKPGEKPYTLIDYFPKDYLLIIDESHVTLPQIKAMYNGDRQRKEVLVEHGFRLPSAMDNRPLKYEEFEKMWNQVRLRLGDAGQGRAGENRRRSGGAGDSAHRAGRSGDRRPARAGAGAASAAADRGACRRRRAGAGDGAHQAAGRGPERLHPGGGITRAVSAQRDSDAGARGDSERSAQGRIRCAGRASICCAKGWICRKCRWWRSWMPTRPGFCAAKHRSFRRSAGRREM